MVRTSFEEVVPALLTIHKARGLQTDYKGRCAFVISGIGGGRWVLDLEQHTIRRSAEPATISVSVDGPRLEQFLQGDQQDDLSNILQFETHTADLARQALYQLLEPSVWSQN